MTTEKEKLIELFEIWWTEEGKFITPGSSDFLETKNVILISWLNGAYSYHENILKDKNHNRRNLTKEI